MPRRNENARPRIARRGDAETRRQGNWGEDYQPVRPPMSFKEVLNPPQGGSGVPNKNIKPPKYDVVSEGYKPMSCIKTTAESIVRDFRKTEGVNFYKDLESMRPLFRPPHRPFFLKRWTNAINWWLIMNRACWAALIACLVYLGIFVYGPFLVKLLK